MAFAIDWRFLTTVVLALLLLRYHCQTHGVGRTSTAAVVNPLAPTSCVSAPVGGFCQRRIITY